MIYSKQQNFYKSKQRSIFISTIIFSHHNLQSLFYISVFNFFSQHDYHETTRNVAFICVFRRLISRFKMFLFSLFNEFAFLKSLKTVRALFNSWRLIWFRCNFDDFDFELLNKIMIITIKILHYCLKLNWSNYFLSQWTMIWL